MSRRPHRRREAAAHASGPAHRAALPRYSVIDALKGLGLCLMIFYHFLFDLTWFRVIRIDFNNDPFWLGYRVVVVALFLALVGVNLVLARRAHPGPRAFWRRIALIAACAVLVSVASYVTFPQTFITFGILHCIAASSVLARPLVDFPRIALLAGIGIIAVGSTVHLPLLDAPWLNWVGMMTYKPPTEDYVPLLPWLGVVLLGLTAGHWLLARERNALMSLGRATPRWLAWLGRHSLLVYLVHQPVLVGILRVLL
jgi:uncharacterized membrane protein